VASFHILPSVNLYPYFISFFRRESNRGAPRLKRPGHMFVDQQDRCHGRPQGKCVLLFKTKLKPYGIHLPLYAVSTKALLMVEAVISSLAFCLSLLMSQSGNYPRILIKVSYPFQYFLTAIPREDRFIFLFGHFLLLVTVRRHPILFPQSGSPLSELRFLRLRYSLHRIPDSHVSSHYLSWYGASSH